MGFAKPIEQIFIKLSRYIYVSKRYYTRKNYNKLPGKPDIVLTRYRIVIFCDSEFFHGKDWEKLKLQLEKGKNSEFWINKISKNIERDEKIEKELNFMGWTVLRFWGKDINKNVDECIKVVEEKIFDNMTADESFFDREE